MGLPLAPWQRDLKWDDRQCQRFITSAWTGIGLGTYVLTDVEMDPGAECRYRYLANCVLDGQQRLHALELYLSDRLAVPDASGVLTKWSELGVADQRWFERRTFDRGVLPLADEAGLRRCYDLMNFGGVAHEEHERAAPLVEAAVPAGQGAQGHAVYLVQGYLGVPPSANAADRPIGEIGSISDVAAHAPLIAEAVGDAERLGFDFPGVFDYEVTERMGAWLRVNPEASTGQFCASLVAEMEKFFGRDCRVIGELLEGKFCPRASEGTERPRGG